MELQTFRQQCTDLEQKVANFIQEKEQFEKEVKWNPVQFAWSEDEQSLEIVRLMRIGSSLK